MSGFSRLPLLLFLLLPAWAPLAHARSSAYMQLECKDGTVLQTDQPRHACSGHGGIAAAMQIQAPAQENAGQATKSGQMSAVKPAAQSSAAAADERVWVNLPTQRYHCQGSRYHGKTKKGAYMTRKQADAQGHQAARGGGCL